MWHIAPLQITGATAVSNIIKNSFPYWKALEINLGRNQSEMDLQSQVDYIKNKAGSTT